jgi:hypothetical protein
MTMSDIDLVEINEAFAWSWPGSRRPATTMAGPTSTAARLRSVIHWSLRRKLMTTLLHELERTGGRYGLQTMCEGGGQANVTIIERL